jgi:hypothetical protein
VDLVEALFDAPGLYVGRGDGIESGPFVGRLVVTPLPSGRGVAIDYEALSSERLVQHVEHALLGLDAEGRHVLYVSHVESPTIAVLVEQRPGYFVDVSAGAVVQQAVEIACPADGELTYAWLWADPGEEPVERSKVDAQLVRQFMDRE